MALKKIQMFLVLLILTLTLFSSSVLAIGFTEMVKGAFMSVVDLATLRNLGSPDSQLIGFIRLVMGILVFTLIYLGLTLATRVVQIPKGIAITIAILLSIITTIFIPGSVLLSIGAAYGTIFSFILFGALLVPALLFFFKVPTGSRGMAALKLAVLGILAWIIGQVNSAALGISQGTFGGQISNLGEFGEWVNTITNYAYFVLIGVAIYLIFKLISPGGASGSWGVSAGSGAWSKVKGWFGGKKDEGDEGPTVASTATPKEAAEREAKEKKKKKTGEKEAAEEAFTLREIKSLKDAYLNTNKVLASLNETMGMARMLGANPVNEETAEKIDQMINTMQEKVDHPLKDALKWNRKVFRMARKVKRDFRKEGARELKEKENQAISIAQSIKTELNNARTESKGSVKEAVKNLEALKNRGSRDNLTTTTTGLKDLHAKIKTLYSHLSVLFKLEEEIKKKY